MSSILIMILPNIATALLTIFFLWLGRKRAMWIADSIINTYTQQKG